MHAVTNLLIVGETTNGKFLADRYNETFKDKRKTMLEDDPDSPTDPETLQLMEFVLEHGMDIRSFQQYVIETYGHYSMAMYDDDLVQQLIEEREYPDMHDIIEIVKEFNAVNPGYDIHSLVPVDMKGTMGFIVNRKP